MNRGKPAGGAALNGKTWKRPCGAAAAELGQGRCAGGAGVKNASSFYSQTGGVGCLRTPGCHYGRPRQPPGSSTSPCKAAWCPQTSLPGQGAALRSGGEHGGLPWPRNHSRSAGMENSWKRDCPRPQLPGGSRLGVYSCQSQGRGWGGLRDAFGGGGRPRAAEGLVVITGNIWAGRQRIRAGLWSKEGWWEQAEVAWAGAVGHEVARMQRASRGAGCSPPRSLGEPGQGL